MSSPGTAEIEPFPIPWQASQALESWDRILANVDRQFRAAQFTRAATEILRLATPDASPAQWQQLVDTVSEMGERHELPVAVVQTLMAAATHAASDRSPGEAGRSALASYSKPHGNEAPAHTEIPEGAEVTSFDPVHCT